MAKLRLSQLKDWTLADPSQDLRGLFVVSPDGQPAGKIVELVVNTETGLAESVVLDNGLAFKLRDLERNGSAVHAVPSSH